MATSTKTKPAAKKTVAATGPITLAQARALAGGATRTATPSRVALKAQVATASPATVAAERKKLRVKQREEIRQRTRDYKATLTIMKKRGVKRLAAAGQPLQILAEGDSWFDYPKPFFGGSIVPRLEDLIGVPILNLAKAGDEVRYMLGVEERKVLAQKLREGCSAGGTWDVLLFSGGGNDIVGNPMPLWIKDFDAALPPAQLIQSTRFKAALALVRAGYEDLIESRNRNSPTTRLIFHSYDFPIPDGRGLCGIGPWLKPTFDLRQFPSLSQSDSAFEVTKVMLQAFTAMLKSLHDPKKGVTFLNTQGTLAPQPGSWDNELHPSRDGFDKIATLFHQKLKQLFPTRVLS